MKYVSLPQDIQKQSQRKTWGKKRLEENLRTLEQDLKNDKNIFNCVINKEELSMICDEVGNGIKGRSLCDWYEFGEKSNKLF